MIRHPARDEVKPRVDGGSCGPPIRVRGGEYLPIIDCEAAAARRDVVGAHGSKKCDECFDDINLSYGRPNVCANYDPPIGVSSATADVGGRGPLRFLLGQAVRVKWLIT